MGVSMSSNPQVEAVACLLACGSAQQTGYLGRYLGMSLPAWAPRYGAYTQWPPHPAPTFPEDWVACWNDNAC